MHKKPRLQEKQCSEGELEQQSPAAQDVMEVHYTVPLGLSFVYEDNKLCFVDKERDMLHILREGVAPPATGLRAQFAWGAQSSSTGQAPQSMRQDYMPDSVLQCIGQQLFHCGAAPVAKATAAAILACTGSRALLIMAHAIWALLQPDHVKPEQYMQQLRQVPGCSSDSKAARIEDTAGEALCIIADPLRCPLPTTLLKSLQRRKDADALLKEYDMTVNKLPDEFGVRQCMEDWIETGLFNDVEASAARAVSITMAWCDMADRVHKWDAVFNRMNSCIR